MRLGTEEIAAKKNAVTRDLKEKRIESLRRIDGTTKGTTLRAKK